MGQQWIKRFTDGSKIGRNGSKMRNFYLLSSAASSSAIFCKPGGTPIWPVLSDAAAAASSFAFSSGDLIAY